jgi:hypothetical protein
MLYGPIGGDDGHAPHVSGHPGQHGPARLLLPGTAATVLGVLGIAFSLMWNVAYDGGPALGGAGFGVLAAHGSYPVAFGLTATLMLVALLPAWRDRTG